MGPEIPTPALTQSVGKSTCRYPCCTHVHCYYVRCVSSMIDSSDKSNLYCDRVSCQIWEWWTLTTHCYCPTNQVHTLLSASMCTHTHHPVAWERSHPMRTVEVRLSVQIYSAEVLFQMFDIHELLSFSLLPDDRNAKQMLSVSLSLPPSLINPLAECLKMGRWEMKVCQKHQMTGTEVTV